MSESPHGRKPSAFSRWLRTGRLPPAASPDGLELKFNPWHDPTDGRFTFAGAGRHYGTGEADTASGASSRTSARAGATSASVGRSKSQTATRSKPETSRTKPPASDAHRAVRPMSSPVQPRGIEGRRPGNQPNPVTEFVGGVSEGLHEVGRETVAGVRAALTTNPVTTVRNTGRGIAAMIDAAIAAEDTPARIQASRAASAVADASARDLGRATATVAWNVALTAAPAAALSKAAALRRFRMARPRTTFDPPQIGWVKEATRSKKPWKAYNDAATGAQPGRAPTLMRTMADGSKRPVKFDGIQGDYVIDRKWKVVDAPRARAQLLRQSKVLAEHRLIGMWEVPTSVQKAKALELLKKMNIANICVKVVKP